MSKEALSVVDTLKLALEALKHVWNTTPDDDQIVDTAIAAIKEALAQQSNEQVEPTCWITPDGEGFRMRMTPPVNDVPLGWTPLFDHPPVPNAELTAQLKEKNNGT